MKIYMTTPMAGPRTLREAGAIYDVEDAEAKRLVNAGYAVQATKDHHAAARLREAQAREEPRVLGPRSQPEPEQRAQAKPAGEAGDAEAGGGDA